MFGRDIKKSTGYETDIYLALTNIQTTFIYSKRRGILKTPSLALSSQRERMERRRNLLSWTQSNPLTHFPYVNSKSQIDTNIQLISRHHVQNQYQRSRSRCSSSSGRMAFVFSEDLTDQRRGGGSVVVSQPPDRMRVTKLQAGLSERKSRIRIGMVPSRTGEWLSNEFSDLIKDLVRFSSATWSEFLPPTEPKTGVWERASRRWTHESPTWR